MTSTSPRSRQSRRLFLLLAPIVVAVALIVTALYASSRGPEPLPEAVDPLLPDLAMAPIEYVDGVLAGTDVRPYLRFGATILNYGAGDFVLSIRRSWPWSDDWVVSQRVPEAGGGFTERATPAGMTYSGDDHDHWHVRAVEAHRLERIDTGEVLAEVVKQGFCFFDTAVYEPELPGAPTKARYEERACDGLVSTSMVVGLSVGWGDVYPPDMIEQRIDLSGIPDGRYRIREIADPEGFFVETDETNNETSVIVDITTEGGIPTVVIVAEEPSVP